MMKNLSYFMPLCGLLAGMMLASCSSRQQSSGTDDIRVLTKDSVVETTPQPMPPLDAEAKVTYKGKEYHSSVVRRPDSTLPLVKNEQGERFVDNRITLRITSGGKTIVNKEFTKQSFASCVDAVFMKHGILEGLTYDKTTPQGILYVAGISYPQTDLYTPVLLTVSADGKISMRAGDSSLFPDL